MTVESVAEEEVVAEPAAPAADLMALPVLLAEEEAPVVVAVAPDLAAVVMVDAAPSPGAPALSLLLAEEEAPVVVADAPDLAAVVVVVAEPTEPAPGRLAAAERTICLPEVAATAEGAAFLERDS